MKKIWKKLNDTIPLGFVLALLIIFGGGIYLGYKSNEKESPIIPTPVEESRIDTLYITRDSLIYRTKYLDSIKHDTIEKVYNLDDSTTLQLFLQLVSE